MTKKYCLPLLIALLASACTEKTPLTSGINIEGMNQNVRPQDDFYEYANGGWLAATEIPADEVGWGSYMTLRKESLEQSRAIVIEAAENPGSDAAKTMIGDYYNAYMMRMPLMSRVRHLLLRIWLLSTTLRHILI